MSESRATRSRDTRYTPIACRAVRSGFLYRVAPLLAVCGLLSGAVAASQAAAQVGAEQSAAQRCFEHHRFGAQPVDVAKTADGQTVLAQTNWNWHDAIGCYLTLDDAALAALRAAPAPQSLPDAETEDSKRCFQHHQFGQRPVDVAKTADRQTVLARLSWGYHDAIGCYLVLDNAALAALRAAAQPEPTAQPTAEPTAEPTPDPTPDPTPEPTPDPTPDPTPEPTPDPTPDPEDTDTTDTETTTGSTVVDLLNTLTVEAEYTGAGYVRTDFDHDRRYLCNDAGTDPYTGISFVSSTCDVDHIVAAQEAFESGAWSWAVPRRQAFGNDAVNLVPTRDCVNRSKGSRDMAEWSGRIGSGTCQGVETTPQGKCYLAWKTIEVKAAYSLSVDQAEKNALTQVLDGCQANGPMQPSGPVGPQPTPEPTPSTETDTTSESDCHPAYSPCLPNLPGDALNCGDLTSDQKPVTVLVPGVDPYRLDRDRDGRGCES